ncbi:uncharacterized protein RHOBADRAFT_50696 [Rhodotorula graminis WP1]|uniref:Splicing factor Cactin n=1 Tax=Rhodotorula graminis (strain WP1) TaxID=578459 RepID=A0A194SBT7_RHOGW|nr:uncharacterized protein RHOBADRAFT_50696 [Rhodotorula graminis WP1]KPV78198.1 hypothetical protein RHOBADRAFT_50696 [Rhodotorula graminis WP1]
MSSRDHRDSDRDDRTRDRPSSSRRRSASPPHRSSSRRDDRDRDPKRDRRDDDHHDRDRERRSDRDRDRDRPRDGVRERHRERERGGDERRSSRRERSRSRSQERSSRDKDRESKKHRHRETSEERRARKAARKAEKAADAALLLPEDARQAAAEVAFYSAQDNPFHDANLGDKFVWGKKREKERKMGMTPEEAAKRDRERAYESQQEIERLNVRRAQREEEFKLREAESMRAARDAESAQMAAWIDREDDFHLEQAKKRAEIRVRERRAKPIDYLALNLKWSQPPLQPGDEGYDEDDEDEGEGLEVDLEEPYAIFEHLTLEDAEELHDDIKMYLQLEKIEAHTEFWRALLIVSSASLEALREERAIGVNAYAAQSRANAAVKAEIQRLLSGKSFDQLVQLQQQVQGKLASGEVIDVEYWEGLLKELVVWKAKAKLRDMHEVVLFNRLEQLRKKQRDEALRYAEEVKNALAGPSAPAKDDHDDDDDEMDVEDDEAEEVGEPSAPAVVADAWNPEWEPALLKRIPEEYRLCQVVDFASDRAQLYAARRAVAQARFVVKPRGPSGAEGDGAASKDDAIYQAAVGQGFDEEEELFNLEAEMSRPSYSWEDKYRPRKPRYFNKVHTGYEWNKYNQTHYDSDNPPPKVVQGYKFNIFYPDLIDKTKAPQYRIIKNKENPDICTITFSAGPPYEDIAFTIVNKQWEHSHKRGFRSSFDRGVLQLHFSFRRTMYRK